jgi:hypothetical protein
LPDAALPAARFPAAVSERASEQLGMRLCRPHAFQRP